MTRLAGLAAAAAAVLPVPPAAAQDAAVPPLATGVYVAAPVGTLTVGAEAVTGGAKRYAHRSNEGSVVAFADRPPPPPLPAGSAGKGLPAMGTITAPLTRGYLTSRFGSRVHPVTGLRRSHAGVDLAAPAGSPVGAWSGGRVSRAGWAGGYGLMVSVQHQDGSETRYAHLSRIAVAPGQQVAAGQVLGHVGSTGLSTGPHLHFERRIAGQAVDPLR